MTLKKTQKCEAAALGGSRTRDLQLIRLTLCSSKLRGPRKLEIKVGRGQLSYVIYTHPPIPTETWTSQRRQSRSDHHPGA